MNNIQKAEKFEKCYAEEYGITIDELRNNRERVVVRCRMGKDCYYEGCNGFNSISRRFAIEDEIPIILPK
jgi:hypothetical protein